jgi:hypothetical protein
VKGTGQCQGTGHSGSWTLPGTGQCEGQSMAGDRAVM